jgi:RNA polymerase sigma factor (sigma-70 family)
MSQQQLLAAVRQLRSAPDQRSDTELLRAFAAARDGEAFTALVRRYHGIVLGVCRRVLHNLHDAEDACQATFLVLLRQARCVRHGEALAAWLHGVAFRIALRAQRSANRRRVHERQANAAAATDPVGELTWREVRQVLDEEVQRLPVIYRSAFLLCCFEGLAHAEAGRRLGIAEGSVSSRVTRARQRLQRALARRGIDLSAVLAVLTLAPASSRAAAAAARVLLAGTAGLSAQVFSLAEGVSGTMGTTRLKLAALVLLMLGLCGGVLLVSERMARATPVPAATGQPAPATTSPPGEPQQPAFTYRGRVLGDDGKPYAGARIYLDYPTGGERSLKQKTVSDKDGRFRFRMRQEEFQSTYKEPWKRASIAAVAPGHGPIWAWAGKPEQAANLTLRLAPDLPVKGRVLDLQGKPVPGVTVWIATVYYATDRDGKSIPYDTPEDKKYSGGLMPIYLLLPKFVTDKDGKVEIHGLGRDRLFDTYFSGPTIESRKGQLVTRPQKARTVPGTGRYDRHGPPTQFQYGAEFVHVAAPCRPICGVVRDADTGKPLAGVYVSKPFQRDDVPSASATSDTQGRYNLLGLPPAHVHDLQVRPAANMPYLPANVRARAADTGLTPLVLDIRLKRQQTVEGRVTERRTGKPVRGWIEYRPLADNPHLKKAPKLAENRFGSQSIVSTSLDAAGRFMLPVLPGKAVLVVRADEPHLPVRIDPANAERTLLDKSDPELLNTVPRPVWPRRWHGYRLLDVATAARTVRCDLAVDAGKSLPLKVVDADGKPCGAWVFGLTPPEDDRLHELTGGAGVIRALAAGERRRLYARSLNGKQAGFVTLRGNDAGAVTLELRPAASVKGRLIDAGGKPLAGEHFQVAYEDGPGRPGLLFLDGLATRLETEAEQKRAFRVDGFGGFSKWNYQTGSESTDTDGRFQIDGLIPGLPFELKAQLTGPPADPKKPKVRPILGMVRVARPTGQAGKTTDLGELRAPEPRK